MEATTIPTVDIQHHPLLELLKHQKYRAQVHPQNIAEPQIGDSRHQHHRRADGAEQTIDAVSGSPPRVICQILHQVGIDAHAQQVQLQQRLARAKGMSSIIVTAIAASRVSDQSRPSRIFALQRGQKALWYDFIFGNVKAYRIADNADNVHEAAHRRPYAR